MTWDELVSKYGQDRASEIAPEKDPRYQQLVGKEGQAKGSAAYAQQILDPETEPTSTGGGLFSDIFGAPGKPDSGLVGQVEQNWTKPGQDAEIALARIGDRPAPDFN